MKSARKTKSLATKIALRASYVLLIMIMFLVMGQIVSAGPVADNGNVLQERIKVSGIVKDNTGEPIMGATVLEKGTKNGTATGVDGKFSLEVAGQSSVLRISFIGYVTVEQPVGTSTNFTIILNEDQELVEEVVVIGYGTQRKADVTSAVSSVKKEDFLAGNIQDASELVKGKIAGLTITKGSGDPNASTTIRLRGIISLQGANTPLVLIDGIEGSLDDVAPESIESIDVLKDASAAAIYGTRGANGVIIVTTNGGKRQEATSVTYSTYATISDLYKVADFMDPHDIRYGLTSFSDGGWDTDWLAAITQLGYTQNHNLGIQGGTEKSSYSVNAGYREERGTIKETNNKELKMQFDMSHWFLNDKLKLNLNILKGIHRNNITDASNSGITNIYRQAVIRNPTIPIYVNGDPEQGYKEDFSVYQYYNPVAMIYEHLGEYKSEWTRMTGGVTIEPIRGWQTELKVSTNRSNGNTESYTTRDYYTQSTSGYDGYAYKSSSYSQSDLLELTSKLNKSINTVHRFTVLAGYSYQYDMYESLSASNYGFPTDAYLYNSLGKGTALDEGNAGMSSYKEDSQLVSFFGRATYSYDNKYNLMVSMRYEGSSKFGVNHKWGTFPSASVGWIISQEDFIKDVTWINYLKLRAGYGVTGMIASASYNSITQWDYNTSSWGYYLDASGNWKPALEVSLNPNPNLKWEKSGELNFGLEYGLFDNRLSGALEYYIKNTNDLLYWYSVPAPPNFKTTTLANAGKMQNSGIELTIQAVPVKTPDFQYTTTIAITHNSNKLVSYSNDLYETDNYDDGGWAGDPISLPTQRVEAGSSFGRYYTLKTAGVNEDGKWMVQNPSTGLYEEFDASMATVDSEYRQWLGTTGIPKVYLGWNNSFRWKNFDMNIQMSSQLGFQIVNEQRMFYENNSIVYNRLKSAADPIPIVDENGNPTGESTTLSTSQSQTILDWYYEDGSFLKIDNFTIGYNFNTSRIRNVNNIRIYLSGQNLLCITKYKGLDPELSNSDIWSYGVDSRDKYPTIRSITLGASINFN